MADTPPDCSTPKIRLREVIIKVPLEKWRTMETYHGQEETKENGLAHMAVHLNRMPKEELG